MNKPVKNTKPHPQRKKLGELLIEAGLIDERTLSKALDIQKIKKKKLGQILVDMGVADQQVIANALASQLNIPLVRLKEMKISKEAISMVPAEIAQHYLLVPVERTDKGLTVAMANPLEFYAVDDLRFVTQMPIHVAVAPESDVLEAIEQFYLKSGLERVLGSTPGPEQGIEIVKRQETEEQDVKDPKEMLALTERPPVVRLTAAILGDAITSNASDIHIEPQRSAVIIRYRIDGIMREIMKTDRHVHASLVSRIKVISNMDISIRRKPQDGKSQVRFGGKGYDLRVSTIPTSYGEKVTMRILSPDSAKTGIEDLGLSERISQDLIDAISMPQGIVLVTGPTGSGKSSTLYACLNRLKSPEVNIVTVEDPIEFDIEGVNQVQINPQAGITFAAGLRSILRQDPDIVMVGEIRDSETASIACQAAQTGHLVLSTLHTNDAPSALTRLLDLGIESFLISESLQAVVGQRLVRTICEECKIPEPLSAQILKRLPPHIKENKEAVFWKGVGCEACRYTGYSGRLGIFEVLKITPSLREAMGSGASTLDIKRLAEKDGFRTMGMDGLDKALKGLTTIEEVFRVAPPDYEGIFDEPVREKAYSEKDRDEVMRSEEPVPSLTSIKPNKILVADDNQIILKLVRHILEADGHLVISAEDGLKALRLAMQEKPDLIVTDYLMPKLNGIELIEKLKARLSSRYIPIIMLTAKEDEDFQNKGIKAGADDYMTKPLNAREFLAKANRLMSRPQ
ncbi:MAG: type II/IV secretion system protein [Deltaproteobacteria bacterium]|nr:type II/IV secretion system protein [Deltaproteobacteria bacterium]